MAPQKEARAAASILLRSFWLMIALTACNKIDMGASTIPHNSVNKKKDSAVAHLKPPAKKKKKKVYLTFDDGPNRGTPKVLHIVEREQVPVTFFLIGEHAFASVGQKNTWDSLKMAEAIDLCNHSYTHAWHNHYDSYYNSPDSVIKDFQRCHDSLQLGNNISRTPGRNTWRIDTLQYTDLRRSKAAVDSLQQVGFTLVGWDLEWHYDPKTLCIENSAEDILRQIDSVFAHNRTRTPEHLVLLAHDQVYAKSNDSAELHALIKRLKENETYELELVSKYPGIQKN